MKLIRLTTDNDDGSFDCDFKTDINIKEGSKIALKSASFKTKNIELTIDDSNDVMTWTFTNVYTNETTIVSIVLDHQEYNASNIATLLQDIQDKFNDALDIRGANYSAKQVGTQFKVSNTKGVIDIEYKVSPFSVNFGYQSKNDINVVPTGANTITKTGAQTTNDTGRLFWNKPFIKGAGVFRANISTMTDTSTADTGFFMGITRTKIDDLDPTTLTAIQKDTYIYVDGEETGAGGFTFQFGNLDANGANPVLTQTIYKHTGGFDTMEIRREGGKIEMGIYRGGGGGGGDGFVSFYEMDDDGTTDYYPYIIMRSASGDCSLALPAVQLDPYTLDTLEAEQTTNPPTGFANPAIPAPLGRGRNVLSMDAKLEKILGYKRDDLVITNVIEASWKGSNVYDFGFYNDTYLILLDNIRLESYDSFDGVERSILGTINVSDDNTNRIVQYESNTLDYIELKNKKEKSLRNIRGRIVKADLQAVEFNGLTSIVVLID